LDWLAGFAGNKDDLRFVLCRRRTCQTQQESEQPELNSKCHFRVPLVSFADDVDAVPIGPYVAPIVGAVFNFQPDESAANLLKVDVQFKPLVVANSSQLFRY
jgi:hypothetical protein